MIICEHDLLNEAAEFFYKTLGLPDNCVIAISVYDKLDVAGYCTFHEDQVIPYCIIGIENDHDQNLLEVLAHEMVHAKQYITGILEDCNDHCLWHGERFEDAHVGTPEYFFAPWEVEAFGMQVGLLHLYNEREDDTRVLH